MRFTINNTITKQIHIHLSPVYDFHPSIFGNFAAFPEIRRFAVHQKNIHKHWERFLNFRKIKNSDSTYRS